MKKIFYLLSTLLIVLFALFTFSGCCLVHDFSNPVIYGPTCTNSGYTLLVCSICGETHKSDYVPPISHATYISEKGCEPTCTQNGYSDELTCKTCGKITQSRYIIPATGHSIEITKEEVLPTCTESGLSSEQKCSVCDALLQAQTTLQAYNHADSDNNSLCDYCGIPHGNNIIPIASVADLKAINSNLSGVYQLTANIDLTGQAWIALGGKTEPFTGYLLGNNFTIKGLSFENSENALFYCISGTVDGVVLENVAFTSVGYSTYMGGLAIYNKGVIKNCTLKGSNTIVQSISRTQQTGGLSLNGTKSTFRNVFGGMCSVNEGTIMNCTVTKSFTSSYFNENKFYLATGLIPPLNARMYASTSECIIYFGNMCGENKGIVSDCNVLSADTNSISVFAYYSGYGSSYAKTNAYIGSIVGINSGTVKSCIAKPSVVVENVGDSETNSDKGGKYPTLNLYMDDLYKGLIGKNDGTIETTVYQ